MLHTVLRRRCHIPGHLDREIEEGIRAVANSEVVHSGKDLDAVGEGALATDVFLECC